MNTKGKGVSTIKAILCRKITLGGTHREGQLLEKGDSDLTNSIAAVPPSAVFHYAFRVFGPAFAAVAPLYTASKQDSARKAERPSSEWVIFEPPYIVSG